jgi:tetratricopeptide (TPR) repeat protein
MMDVLGEYFYIMGAGLSREGRISRAVEVLEAAIAFKKNHWKAWNLLGLCCYRLGEFSRARYAWSRSIQLQPHQNPALEYMYDLEDPAFSRIIQCYNKALELAAGGKYRQAGDMLERALPGLPPIVSYVNLLGLCRYGQGRIKTALKFWAHAIELDYENPDAVRYIRSAAVESNRAAAALPAFLGRLFQRLTGTDIFTEDDVLNEE